ncbi:MAG TPA: aromatic ring-hydroxylating dioxygenase subunit alpha [Stellaceae bacterium]|nr:aromatic ring-hydroxylating dioxygenase subunit alpha [Stellaceae bacterium]
MLATRQKVLRKFWCPVMALADLKDGPKPFTLLGEELVLWLAAPKTPVAMRDRCCHRSARLSRGSCDRGRLICGYHGWEFNSEGAVVRLPQNNATEDHATRMGVDAYRCAERYGYVWVALEEPLYDIPDFEEAHQPGFRQIDQFNETWNCAGLRLMENSFDNAHFSFVHRASFGDNGHPQPAKLEIESYDDGFLMVSDIPVINPEIQQKLLRIDSDRTVRHMRARWYMPFGRKLQITYPNGLVHSIVTYGTPIDDQSCQVVQFCFRSDTEAEAPAETVNAFDRKVTLEDKYILEATDGDVPLDQAGFEYNMASDRPGIVMRQMLRALLERQGEAEAKGENRPVLKPLAPPTDLRQAG